MTEHTSQIVLCWRKNRVIYESSRKGYAGFKEAIKWAKRNGYTADQVVVEQRDEREADND